MSWSKNQLGIRGLLASRSLAVAHLGQSLCDGAEPWWNLGRKAPRGPSQVANSASAEAWTPARQSVSYPTQLNYLLGAWAVGLTHGLQLEPEHHLSARNPSTRARLNEGIS